MTNTIRRSPSWEPYSFSAIWAILSAILEPDSLLPCLQEPDKSAPQHSILFQWYPRIQSKMFKADSFLQAFPPKPYIYRIFCAWYMVIPLYSPWFYHPKNVRGRLVSWSPSLYSFVNLLVVSSLMQIFVTNSPRASSYVVRTSPSIKICFVQVYPHTFVSTFQLMSPVWASARSPWSQRYCQVQLKACPELKARGNGLPFSTGLKRWMGMERWWSDGCKSNSEVIGKDTCPNAIVPTTNIACTVSQLKPDLFSEKTRPVRLLLLLIYAAYNNNKT